MKIRVDEQADALDLHLSRRTPKLDLRQRLIETA
jgi:hypothetical protein